MHPELAAVHVCCNLQVIAVICVLVWVMNINRFSDPALGGWVNGEQVSATLFHLLLGDVPLLKECSPCLHCARLLSMQCLAYWQRSHKGLAHPDQHSS